MKNRLDELCDLLKGHTFEDNDPEGNYEVLTVDIMSEIAELKDIIADNFEAQYTLANIYLSTQSKSEDISQEVGRAILNGLGEAITGEKPYSVTQQFIDDKVDEISSVKIIDNNVETYRNEIMGHVTDLVDKIRLNYDVDSDQLNKNKFWNASWDKIEGDCQKSLADGLEKLPDQVKEKLVEHNAGFFQKVETDDSSRYVTLKEFDFNNNGDYNSLHGISFQGSITCEPEKAMDAYNAAMSFVEATNEMQREGIMDFQYIDHDEQQALRALMVTLELDPEAFKQMSQEYTIEQKSVLEKFSQNLQQLYGVEIKDPQVLSSLIEKELSTKVDSFLETKEKLYDIEVSRSKESTEKDKMSQELSGKNTASADFHGRSIMWNPTGNEKIDKYLFKRNAFVERAALTPYYRKSISYTYNEMRAIFAAHKYDIPINGQVPTGMDCISAYTQFINTNILDYAAIRIVGVLIDFFHGSGDEVAKDDVEKTNPDVSENSQDDIDSEGSKDVQINDPEADPTENHEPQDTQEKVVSEENNPEDVIEDIEKPEEETEDEVLKEDTVKQEIDDTDDTKMEIPPAEEEPEEKAVLQDKEEQDSDELSADEQKKESKVENPTVEEPEKARENRIEVPDPADRGNMSSGGDKKMELSDTEQRLKDILSTRIDRKSQDFKNDPAVKACISDIRIEKGNQNISDPVAKVITSMALDRGHEIDSSLKKICKGIESISKVDSGNVKIKNIISKATNELKEAAAGIEAKTEDLSKEDEKVAKDPQQDVADETPDLKEVSDPKTGVEERTEDSTDKVQSSTSGPDGALGTQEPQDKSMENPELPDMELTEGKYEKMTDRKELDMTPETAAVSELSILPDTEQKEAPDQTVVDPDTIIKPEEMDDKEQEAENEKEYIPIDSEVDIDGDIDADLEETFFSMEDFEPDMALSEDLNSVEREVDAVVAESGTEGTAPEITGLQEAVELYVQESAVGFEDFLNEYVEVDGEKMTIQEAMEALESMPEHIAEAVGGIISEYDAESSKDGELQSIKDLVGDIQDNMDIRAFAIDVFHAMEEMPDFSDEDINAFDNFTELYTEDDFSEPPDDENSDAVTLGELSFSVVEIINDSDIIDTGVEMALQEIESGEQVQDVVSDTAGVNDLDALDQILQSETDMYDPEIGVETIYNWNNGGDDFMDIPDIPSEAGNPDYYDFNDPTDYM